MKVLLFNPKGPSEGYGVGLAYIAAVLIRKGHSVRVIDYHNREDNKLQRLADGLRWQPDVIGASMNSFTVVNAKKIIGECRERYKKKTVYIAGGPYVTMKQEDFLRENKEFDCAACGEAELTFIQLLDALKKRKGLGSVKGIIYRKGNKIIKTGQQELVDIDKLPFPDFSVYDSVKGYIPVYPLLTSRGCPYSCVFCLNVRLFGRKWRSRKPENVVEELMRAKKEYNLKTYAIQDDNFTLNKERAKEILRLVIKKKINMPFSLPNGIRADMVDMELALLLKKAGCGVVKIGIENGDPATFEYVKKGESLEEIEKGVKILKKAGLRVESFMIIGLINTDYKSVMRSLAFVKKLGIKTNWYNAIPFEHTELYDWVKEKGRFLAHSDKLVGSLWTPDQPILFETPEFSAKERKKAFYICNSETGNYEFFAIGSNYIEKSLNILKTLWQYNKKRIPHFMFFGLRKIFRLARGIPD